MHNRSSIIRKVVYGLLGFNLMLSMAGIALFGFTMVAYHPWVAAQTAGDVVAQSVPGVSIGLGLGLLGTALATAGSSLGSGVALSKTGAAAIRSVTKRRSMFGITLVYVGLAGGIATYGIVISVMILGRL